jgi:hypothetical protein
MDPVLFKVAEAGNIGPFENCQTCLDQLLTPDENTILHVYLKNQSREPEFTDFVDTILVAWTSVITAWPCHKELQGQQERCRVIFLIVCI